MCVVALQIDAFRLFAVLHNNSTHLGKFCGIMPVHGDLENTELNFNLR